METEAINKINVNQICSVRSFLKEKSSYVYKKKSFWYDIKKDGFYSFYGFISKEQVEEESEMFIEDNKLYYYPHLEINMANRTEHKIFFKTVEELNKFMETEPMKNVVWINK